ncbi:MAG: hypothetical protein LBD57_06140 [Endomicrobium sp.]|uniref:hypothetical protein n=1 Tax=Candidatus Endomicrobiellum cubanum TaxID=3242325 RepID=UPI002829B1F4|nr:hypothetical protein [Endomicrobium sp.]
MKKYFFIVSVLFFFIFWDVISYANLVENIDYSVDFQEKTPNMAAILHINFISVFPDAYQAEEIVKQQLKKYGVLIIQSGHLISTVKKEKRYKNIIGSAWYINELDPTNPTKIKFQKDLGAYVWIGKTKTIVTFPKYMIFLKKNLNKHTK